jgi:hypothetical protein
MLVDQPMRFPGTREEVLANLATHWFDYQYDRCCGCDCRPWGALAEWPCGADVPRVLAPASESPILRKMGLA